MILQRFLRTHIAPLFGGDRRFAQLSFIAEYRFPRAVLMRFAAAHPTLDAAAHAQVFAGLRDYFAICAADPRTRAGMPSAIVDDAWHTFILSTRDYTAFCERAFGGYLHHAPADAAGNEDDIGHTWRLACAREQISPTSPSRLPRLFAIDRDLAVPGARYYALNETDAERTRQMMGNSAMVSLAIAFGMLDSWTDPIFREMHELAPHHDANAIGGDGMQFADAGGFGGADGDSSGGGCSGGGS